MSRGLHCRSSSERTSAPFWIRNSQHLTSAERDAEDGNRGNHEKGWGAHGHERPLEKLAMLKIAQQSRRTTGVRGRLT